MTRTELAMGSAISIAVIVAGSLSVTWVDRHFAAAGIDSTTASGDHHEP